MATHDEKPKGKEVLSSNSFPNHLYRRKKYELIKFLLETQDKLYKRTATCHQIEKDLENCKDHVSYRNFFSSEMQNRFFDLLDQNVMLKETLEKVK